MTVSPAMAVIDPESVLQRLTLDDKIRLLSGDDMWHTAPVPEADVPRVRVGASRCSAELRCVMVL